MVPAVLNRESAETQSKQRATERHWNPLRSRQSAPTPSRRREPLLHGTINQCLKANTLCITEKQIKGPKYVSGVVCFCVVLRTLILMFISSRTLSVQVSKCCIYAQRLVACLKLASTVSLEPVETDSTDELQSKMWSSKAQLAGLRIEPKCTTLDKVPNK